MKILIAVPTFENIYPDTFKSIYDLDKGEHDVDFEFVRGYDCATARNRIAQRSLDGGYDYVLMVDNDVVLPRDALLNLLEHQCDVILGYYAHRGTSNTYEGKVCICKLVQPDGQLYFNYPYESLYEAAEVAELRSKGIYQVHIHGGGMGCALIKVETFRRLGYPWFDWINYSDRHGTLSEDLFFCEQLKNAKIPVYADTRVGCGHLLRRVQWPTI